MKRRLYFIMPDVKTAHKVEQELLLKRIDVQHIHFMAAIDAKLGDLPKASIFQGTDLKHGMFVGLMAGGITGAALGFLLYLYPAFGATLGMGPILALAVAGAIFGSWASGMIAVSMPNSYLNAFDKKLRKDKLLLMVDVPKEQVDDVSKMMAQLHPDVLNQGIESHIPAFP